MRTILVLGFLSLFGLVGSTLARTQPTPDESQSERQIPQLTKSVSGTVKSIGYDSHSFTLEVSRAGGKQTLDFVLEQGAEVQGHVVQGTPVKVQYVASSNQNLAKTVTAQGSQG